MARTIVLRMKETGIAIFAAVAMEGNAIASALGLKPARPGRPSGGGVGEMNVCLHLVGIGARGLEKIVFDERPRWLVMAGFAGALDPALKIGDVVVSGCPEGARERLGAVAGTFHTSAGLISTPAQKAELFLSTGARAVDMETAPVEQWATRQGIPFIAIRAISDGAADALDRRVLSLVDEWGRPRTGAVAGYLLSNPLRVRELARLAASSKLAAGRLGVAVRELVYYLAATSDNHGRAE